MWAFLMVLADLVPPRYSPDAVDVLAVRIYNTKVYIHVG